MFTAAPGRDAFIPSMPCVVSPEIPVKYWDAMKAVKFSIILSFKHNLRAF